MYLTTVLIKSNNQNEKCLCPSSDVHGGKGDVTGLLRDTVFVDILTSNSKQYS